MSGILHKVAWDETADPVRMQKTEVSNRNKIMVLFMNSLLYDPGNNVLNLPIL